MRFKARIVAQGFNQIYGTEYDETFAPVTRYNTVRTSLATAGRDKMVVKHLDDETAYLHGNLEEEIYMRQPPACEIKEKEDKVCLLRKSIYGLKQAARCWKAIGKMGFKSSQADPCLFTLSGTYLIVYVDDLLVRKKAI